MTSINRVIMVGNIITKPEVLETSGKKKYIKFKLETWNLRKINGEVKKLTAQHTVLCFNQLALEFLESASPGTRIHLTGELDYDRQGNPQVVVPQYVGDLGAMDLSPDVEVAEHKPEEAKSKAPSIRPFGNALGSGFPRSPAKSITAPVSAKAGGGLGRLPLKKSTQPSQELPEKESISPNAAAKGTKTNPQDRYMDTDGFTDSIPF